MLQQCEKQVQKPEVLIYKLLGAQKIKNKNADINTGSPPPLGSKKAVLKFLSVSSIVIAPAKTGKDNKSKKAVMKTAQTNNGVLWAVIPGALIFIIVIKINSTKNWRGSCYV